MRKRIRYLIKPRALSLQWHITERCNWRCKHCYREYKFIKEEMSWKELKNVLNQYIETCEIMNIKRRRVTIAGGEPFLRKKELFRILKILRRENIPSGILTNGSLITRAIAKKLRKLRTWIQVSLEGTKKVNDEIRGKGTYEKILNAIKTLAEEHVPVSVSFTSHKKNMEEFFKLAEIVGEIGATLLWTDRLVPIGMGSQLREYVIPPQELKEYYYRIVRLFDEKRKKGEKPAIGVRRTLFCLIFEEHQEIKAPPFRFETCPAGSNIVIIMPNGDVYPCRRLPIKVGNVREEHLIEIWYKSNTLWKLRDMNELPEHCKKCKYLSKCYGGARCIAYGYFGDFCAPDPQCWIAFKNLPSPQKYKAKKNTEEKDFWPKPHLLLPTSSQTNPREKNFSLFSIRKGFKHPRKNEFSYLA